MSRLFENENPADLLWQIGDVLAALDIAVTYGHGAMNERTARGVGWVLGAAARAVDDARETVERVISDPFSAGYRKGMDLADAEYRRGFKEGRAAANQAAGVAA